METVRFKRTDWIIIAIIIVFIICVVIWETKRSGSEAPEESRLSALSKRLKELEQQIEKEMESLRLTQEMKLFVDKKISRIFLLAKIGFTLLAISVMGLFYFSGQDIITSMLSGAGVISLIFAAGSFLLVSRFVDPNTMIESGRELICKWIYKKYGFDPIDIQVLQESIGSNKIEVNEISIAIGVSSVK